MNKNKITLMSFFSVLYICFFWTSFTAFGIENYRIVNNKGKAVKLEKRVPEYNAKIMKETHKNGNSLNNRIDISGYPIRTKLDDSGEKYYTSNKLEREVINSKKKSIQNDYKSEVYKSESDDKNFNDNTKEVVYKRNNKEKDTVTSKKHTNVEHLKEEESDTKYYIEVGSYKSRKKAVILSKEIAQNIKIPLEPQFDGVSYIVSIGPLFSKKDAMIMKQELKQYGYSNSKTVVESE